MLNTKNDNQIMIYNSDDGKMSFDVNMFSDTVWLSQRQMAELFGRDYKTISKHINNIFKEKELQRKSVVAKFATTGRDGKIYQVEYYNLDVIISVGYRVKSKRGTQFRIWATSILKQYSINGYAINENRIKLIEDKIDILSNNLKSDSVELKSDIKEIYKILNQISNRPINIYNQISLASNKLEERLIELIDELIKNFKLELEEKEQLLQIKKELSKSPKDQNTKEKISKFFTDLGDKKSALNKKLNSISVSRKIISELIKLGEKLKEFF